MRKKRFRRQTDSLSCHGFILRYCIPEEKYLCEYIVKDYKSHRSEETPFHHAIIPSAWTKKMNAGICLELFKVYLQGSCFYTVKMEHVWQRVNSQFCQDLEERLNP